MEKKKQMKPAKKLAGFVSVGGDNVLKFWSALARMNTTPARRVTPPRRGTSPTWGPPPPCKQALRVGELELYINHHKKER